MQPAHTTKDEKNFIDQIGSCSEPGKFFGQVETLTRYVAALQKREHWSDMSKTSIVEYATQKLIDLKQSQEIKSLIDTMVNG